MEKTYIFAILAAKVKFSNNNKKAPVRLQLSVWAPQKVYPAVKWIYSLLVNFCLLYMGKYRQCQNARPCEIHTSWPSFVSGLRPKDSLFPQIIPTIPFRLTRLSAHPVIDRIILQIWRVKMHPTVKWRHVVCSWAEPIGHVTSVAGDNRPACPSRWGYTQLVQFLERRSQILNNEILIFHA